MQSLGLRTRGVHAWLVLHVWFKFWDAAIWDFDCLVFISVTAQLAKNAALERFEKVHNQNNYIVKSIKI